MDKPETEGGGRDLLLERLSPAALWWLLHLIAVPICVLTVTGFLGRWHWLLDLTAHFRVQYAVTLAALAALYVWRKRRAALITACFALVNLALIAPYWFDGNAQQGTPDTGKPLRVLFLNVHRANTRHDLARAFLARSRPDVIVLAEVDVRWLRELGGLRHDYPHTLPHPREDDFGIALWSRTPLRNPRIERFGSTGVPSVVAGVEIAGRMVTLVGTHPVSPAGARGTRRRDEHLSALARFVETRQEPVAIVGDLNTTPWSYSFQSLLRHAGLTDSARGRGIQATWPAGVFYLRIPIDYCLLTPGIVAIRRQVGPDVGSDHFPLLIDLR